ALGEIDGSLAIAAAGEGVARAWDVQSGNAIAELTWEPGDAGAVGVVDSALLVAHSFHGVITVTGGSGKRHWTQLVVQPGHALTFLGQNTFAALGNHRVELFDATTGDRRCSPVAVDWPWELALGRIGDDEILAWANHDGIGLWNVTREE